MKDTVDYEVAIFKTLARKNNLTYSQLFVEVQSIQSFNHRTFSKYLKKMMFKGIIYYKSTTGKQGGIYSINPDDRTRYEKLHTLIDSLKASHDESSGETHKLLDDYDKSPRKTRPWKNNDVRWKLVKYLFDLTRSWFEQYYIMIFMINSSHYPKVMEDEGMKLCKYQLRRIERLFRKMKNVDPVLYNKVYNAVLNSMHKKRKSSF